MNTERKTKQIKHLKESPEYVHAIIDSLNDDLIIINEDYQITEANRRLLSRIGKNRSEIIGKPCYEVIHELQQPCPTGLFQCPLLAVWQTGEPTQITRNVAPAGEQEQFVNIIASPILNSEGKVASVVVLMKDITEILELERKVAKAREDLSALNHIAMVVTSSLDLDTVLSSALDTTLEIMNRTTGGIMLLDEDSRTLYYCINRGLSDRYARKMKLKIGEGISGMVAKTGKTILVEDASTDKRATHVDLIKEEGIRTFISIPLHSKETVMGVLNIFSHEPGMIPEESVQHLESIAAQVSIAIENARLHQEVQEKDERRGELLQDIFSIQEEERRRIARELHDETSQVLASLTASLEAASGMLSDSKEKARAMLKRAQNLSIQALDETHKLIYELRPTLLDDLGLISAMRWLITNNLEQAGIQVDFRTLGTARRLDPQVETTLFRVSQEAMNNIARHSGAKKAVIRLQFKKNLVMLRVSDNGQGFDVEEAIRSKDRPRGLGLLGMRERVEIMKGTLSMKSPRSRGGTEIKIQIPMKTGGG